MQRQSDHEDAGKSALTLPGRTWSVGATAPPLCHGQAAWCFSPRSKFDRRTTVPHRSISNQYGAVCTHCHSPGQAQGRDHTPHRDARPAIIARPTTSAAPATRPSGPVRRHDGDGAFPQEIPNVMVEQVACVGCHDLTKKLSIAGQAEKCTNARQGLQGHLAMWQGQVGRPRRPPGPRCQGRRRPGGRPEGPPGLWAAPATSRQAQKDYSLVVRPRAPQSDLAEAILSESKKAAERAVGLLGN